jgi:hypothetical protein
MKAKDVVDDSVILQWLHAKVTMIEPRLASLPEGASFNFWAGVSSGSTMACKTVRVGACPARRTSSALPATLPQTE